MSQERCPRCGRVVTSDLDANEPMCLPTNCQAWRVIGISRNGGPLLTLVEGATAS